MGQSGSPKNEGNAVGKMSLAGTSLVAAIPGGVLAYLMLMAVLNHLDPMPTILKVSAISLLVVSGAVALFPFFILIYGPKSPEAAAKAKSKQDEKSAQSAAAAAPGGDEAFAEAAEAEGEAESFASEEGFEGEEFEAADDEVFEADGFSDTEDEMEAGEYDDEFEFDEFEDEEDK